MDIIKIEKNELRLNSGIAEENFGKMSYAQIITEQGVLITGEKSGDNYEFNYDTWAFDDVQAFGEIGNRNVFYCGKIPFFSKNVSTLLDALDSENAFNAGFAFMQLLTSAAKEQRELNIVGAGGILIEFDKKENVTILILPQSLYGYSIAGLSEKEKAKLQNWWINPTLKGIQSYRFMRAVIAYKVITGNVPYPATDIIERNADILDEKFLPLEYCVNGINLNFSDRISDELALNAASVTIPGKKQKKSIIEKLRDDVKKEIPKDEAGKEKFFSETYFKAITNFPFDEFKKIALSAPESSISEEAFNQKKESFLKKQNGRVKTKRFFRRNKATILVASGIIALVAILIANTIKSNFDNPTSKGLTAEQTVEAYFLSMNRLDTILASNITKGKKVSRNVDVISQVFVMGKQRQAYDKAEGFMNPAAFMLFTSEKSLIGKNGLYGVSNLKINGKESNIDIKPFVKKDKPEPITVDGGIPVSDKMQKTVAAEYYAIHSEEDKILVNKNSDTFTLTFIKNRWLITDIEQNSTETEVELIPMLEKYFALLEENDGDKIKSISALKEEYDWLPKEQVLKNEISYQSAQREEWMKSYGL